MYLVKADDTRMSKEIKRTGKNVITIPATIIIEVYAYVFLVIEVGRIKSHGFHFKFGHGYGWKLSLNL